MPLVENKQPEESFKATNSLYHVKVPMQKITSGKLIICSTINGNDPSGNEAGHFTASTEPGQ